jgi:hypothetical protein
MKFKVTNLKKDTHFLYNELVYKKIDDYNKSNRCLNVDNGEITEIPLMSKVELVEKKKKTRKKNEDNSEKTDSDGLRDGRSEARELQSDPASVDSSGLEETGNNSGLRI